eukprot:14507389-Ditylum_brightwellii.AAC.1
MSNIPIGKLKSTETDKLLKLESVTTHNVKGQERAVRSVARVVQRSRSGLRDMGCAIASLLFCGPTGEERGKLAKAVRQVPHSVVLLDELEKAHGDVFNILLQIMEDGMLTDGKGCTVNFKNSTLVMMPNVGSHRILDVSNQWKSRKSSTDETSGVNGDAEEAKQLQAAMEYTK